MQSNTPRNRKLTALLLLPLVPLLALLFAGAYPNVPLYVHWDGTIAAPTQFLSATFKSGANIVFTDTGTNLTIGATTGVGSNSVVIVPGTNMLITTNITGSNISYTISSSFVLPVTNMVTIAPGTDITVSTNLTSTNVTYTVSASIGWTTNRSVTIATNATSKTLDYSGVYQHYDVPTLLITNLTLSPTNLVQGREIWVFLTAANGNYDVTVTNTAANAVHWNINSTTNGSTSFTVTNGMSTELSIIIRSNNIIQAVYGHYR